MDIKIDGNHLKSMIKRDKQEFIAARIKQDDDGCVRYFDGQIDMARKIVKMINNIQRNGDKAK